MAASNSPKSRPAWRRAVTVLVVPGLVGAALFAGHPATADQITDQIGHAQQQLAQDGSTMAKLRAEIAAAQNQAAALQKAIDHLNAQIAVTQAQVGAAQAALNTIQKDLSDAQANLAATQAQLASDKQHLSAELVLMYKAQNASNSFSNFLSSGDFNSFWQRYLDVHRLGQSEQHLVDSVTAEEQTVEADVARISSKRAQQAQALAALRGILGQLDSAVSARQAAQQRLAQIQAQDAQRLAEMEQAARELNAQIAHLQAQEAAALAAGGGSGHFAWAETGPISQGFGCTDFAFEPYDASCPSRHFHSGIDIAAPCGNDIAAADNGIAHLYYSSYGYGLHVIIVHGNGWVSVYGHMSSFSVSDGQTVTRGQLIGHEGSTGNSTGCHLHFEVDLNNSPRNPIAFLS